MGIWKFSNAEDITAINERRGEWLRPAVTAINDYIHERHYAFQTLIGDSSQAGRR